MCVAESSGVASSLGGGTRRRCSWLMSQETSDRDSMPAMWREQTDDITTIIQALLSLSTIFCFSNWLLWIILNPLENTVFHPGKFILLKVGEEKLFCFFN